MFLKEQSNHTYSVSAYFIGKSLVDLPVESAVIIVYAAITYPLIGFATDSFAQFVSFTGTLILVAYAGQSIGLVVGSAVPNRALAATLAPLSIAPFILFTPYAIPRTSHVARRTVGGGRWAVGIGWCCRIVSLRTNEFDCI